MCWQTSFYCPQGHFIRMERKPCSEALLHYHRGGTIINPDIVDYEYDCGQCRNEPERQSSPQTRLSQHEAELTARRTSYATKDYKETAERYANGYKWREDKDRSQFMLAFVDESMEQRRMRLLKWGENQSGRRWNEEDRKRLMHSIIKDRVGKRSVNWVPPSPDPENISHPEAVASGKPELGKKPSNSQLGEPTHPHAATDGKSATPDSKPPTPDPEYRPGEHLVLENARAERAKERARRRDVREKCEQHQQSHRQQDVQGSSSGQHGPGTTQGLSAKAAGKQRATDIYANQPKEHMATAFAPATSTSGAAGHGTGAAGGPATGGTSSKPTNKPKSDPDKKPALTKKQ